MADTYELLGDSGAPVDLAPKNEVQEILQNVRTIVTTIKGSVPLDRTFGISADVVDRPMLQARAKLTDEIVQAIRKHEPRAVIDNISFTADLNGELIPKLRLTITPTGG